MRRIGGVPAPVAQILSQLRQLVGTTLRFDKAQTLTASQQARGLANLGAVALGTGADQSAAHLVALGLGVSVNQLKASVDGGDFGAIWTDRDAVFAPNYHRFPSGMILQWGIVAGGADRIWVFPTTFPLACFGLVGIANQNAGPGYINAVAGSVNDASSATIRPRVATSSQNVGIAAESSFVVALGR